MAYSLSDKLVIAISSRALFDLELENSIYESEGTDAYAKYQRAHEDQPLKPGTAFPLIKALLELNQRITSRRLVEVVVISRNSPDTGLRAFNAIEAHKLDITRAAFTGGRASLVDYLKAFEVDLFLSRDLTDAQEAVDAGIAAAQLYDPPESMAATEQQIRIAFDGDAVLFSPDSEHIFKTKGLAAFLRYEKKHRKKSMTEGPFAKLLLGLSDIQKQFTKQDCPVRIAIVTARNSPAHGRVIHTLRDWGVQVDEAFFLGGVDKDQVLKAFGAQIFFDDQHTHVSKAASQVPSGIVPYVGGTLTTAVKKGKRRGKSPSPNGEMLSTSPRKSS
jgi:5'-nucleotidase